MIINKSQIKMMTKQAFIWNFEIKKQNILYFNIISTQLGKAFSLRNF